MTVDLTQDEWNTVTAALLALQDNRNDGRATREAVAVLRGKIRFQLAAQSTKEAA